MNKGNKVPIILLHGWGKTVSGKRYEELANLLKKQGYIVYTPDLPGFGNNSLTKDALLFEDYVQFVVSYIKKIHAKKVVLLGHSFGGRIAIRCCAQYPELVEKLILVDASGIPAKLGIKKSILAFLSSCVRPVCVVPPISYLYGFLRKLLYTLIGEMDYYRAGTLSETFKNVYRIDIRPDLVQVNVKTLILWGEYDTFTPVSDGEYMYAHMKNATFVIIPKASHKLPYENPSAVFTQVHTFLS